MAIVYRERQKSLYYVYRGDRVRGVGVVVAAAITALVRADASATSPGWEGQQGY